MKAVPQHMRNPKGSLGWPGLWRGVLALCLVFAATPVGAAPASFLKSLDLLADNPSQAVREAQLDAQRAATVQEKFWAQLALGWAQTNLEQFAAARASVAQARQALAAWPAPQDDAAAWLEIADGRSKNDGREIAPLRQQLLALRQRLASPTEPALACELSHQLLWMLVDLPDLDAAWREAETLERCGKAVGRPALTAGALLMFGRLRSKVETGTDAQRRTAEPFEQALAVMGSQGLRSARSVLHWEYGQALQELKEHARATEQFERAIALCLEIDDPACQVVAYTSLALTQLESGQAAAAWESARQGRQAMAAAADESREVDLLVAELTAAARLHRPEVDALMGRLRHQLGVQALDEERVRATYALAEGQAARGQFDAAYKTVLEANDLKEQWRRLTRDHQLMDLQQRYDSTRHRAEVEKLQLESQTAEATRRSLWMALGALGVALTGAAAYGRQVALRRREAAELSLRDDLTGQPNRRAVMSFAEQQLRLARAEGHPLCLAMLDLDHFKQVNDTHGHVVGDAVLRAFAQAAAAALRSGDRLGRYGGEEWMLVLPGTRAVEAAMLYQRIRERFAEAQIDGLPWPHGLSFSMGVAQGTGASQTLDDLIVAADQQLYRAKQTGRDRCCATPGD